MKDYYAQFVDALSQATAKVEERYFAVRVAGSDSPIARERAYCYELYHQLRGCLDDEPFPFTLHGEIDKRGHPMLADCVAGRNPDFVVHQPGTAGPHGNLCVMGVKQAAESVERMAADLHGLGSFASVSAIIAAFFSSSVVRSNTYHSLFWHPEAGTTWLEVEGKN